MSEHAKQLQRQNQIVTELIAGGVPDDNIQKAGKDRLAEIVREQHSLLNSFHSALTFVENHRKQLIKVPSLYVRRQQVANSVLNNVALGTAQEYITLMDSINDNFTDALTSEQLDKEEKLRVLQD